MVFLKKTEINIFLTVWIVYITFASGFGGNYMATSVLYGTMAFVDNGVFYTDDYIQEGCNESGCDHAFYNGHFYSGYAPGGSFLALPLYVIFKPFLDFFISDSLFDYSALRLKIITFNLLAIIFISSLLSALLSVLLYKTLEYFSINKKNRLIITFIFAFATLMFVYSSEYNIRTISVFFAFLAFYLLFSMKNEKRINKKYLFFAGLSSAFSIALTYTDAIIFVLLFLYLLTFLRDRRIVWFLFGASIILSGILLYHYVIFDDPLTTAYHHRASTDVPYTQGTADLTYPNWYRIWNLSFSPFKGVFFYMPILLLSFYGLFLNFRKNKFFIENLFILSIFLAYFFYNASLSYSWHANCAFGPRYLIMIIPFFMLPLMFVIEKTNVFIFIFGILSFFINYLGTIYMGYVTWVGGCVDSNQIFNYYIPILLNKGLSNYSLELINKKITYLSNFLTNFISIFVLFFLGIIIYLIWKK